MSVRYELVHLRLGAERVTIQCVPIALQSRACQVFDVHRCLG